jgi:hypothetical protein
MILGRFLPGQENVVGAPRRTHVASNAARNNGLGEDEASWSLGRHVGEWRDPLTDRLDFQEDEEVRICKLVARWLE